METRRFGVHPRVPEASSLLLKSDHTLRKQLPSRKARVSKRHNCEHFGRQSEIKLMSGHGEEWLQQVTLIEQAESSREEYIWILTLS